MTYVTLNFLKHNKCKDFDSTKIYCRLQKSTGIGAEIAPPVHALCYMSRFEIIKTEDLMSLWSRNVCKYLTLENYPKCDGKILVKVFPIIPKTEHYTSFFLE